MTGVGRLSGYIELDGKPYFIASSNGKPMYQPMSFPTQEGDPTSPRRYAYSDWSKGMGDSRGAFRGAVAIATNAWLGSPGRILPGPKINTIASANGAPITKFVVVTAPANRVIAFGGRYAKEIDPSAHTVSTTEDFGVGTSVLDACLFIDHVAVALGESTLFEKRNASGAYAANTLTGNNRYARAFGLSVEGDLVRGRSFYWSKCSAADFYGTDNNWSVEYDIGDRSGNINQVFAFQRADYVLKDEGLYSFYEESSKEANVLPVLEGFKSSENRRYFVKDNRLFLCTYAGLYRLYHQGPARTVGIEEAAFNETELANCYPTAGVAFGTWQCEALYDAAADHTYITLARESRDGDASYGSPSTEVCIIDEFDGECRAMVIPSKVTSTPELWYARDENVAWIKLRRDGRPAEFRDSGSVRVEMAPNDFGTPFTAKYFRGVELVGRNAHADRGISVSAVIDEGSENQVGADIESLSSGFASRFWTLASNDSGRKIQPIVEMECNSTTTAPEVRELVINYEERPIQVPGFATMLEMRDSGREGDVTDRRSALEQRQALEAILDGSPVSVVDGEGNSYTGAIFRFDGEALWQRGGQMPQHNVTIGVRRLDYQ